jgi:hypothetical protein
VSNSFLKKADLFSRQDLFGDSAGKWAVLWDLGALFLGLFNAALPAFGLEFRVCLSPQRLWLFYVKSPF